MLLKSLMLCFGNDIWYDELFTVGMIKHSYGDLIAFTAQDVHPPLYYCIVKFFVDLCKLISAQTDPVVVTKVVSVLPYFILLLYCITFIRKRFGMFAGGLFFFCSIAMPQLSSYTVEMRMYSFALLFVTAAFLHAYGVVTAGRNIACEICGGISQNGAEESGGTAGENTVKRTQRIRMGRIHAATLVFYGLAAAYTQYFACVAVIMVYLYVLAVFLVRDRGRIKEWLLWVAVSVLGYIPWLFALFAQITAVRENYWILPLTWRSLGGCVKFLMKPAFTSEILSTVLAVVLFAAYVSVILYPTLKLCHYRIENRKKAVPDGISELIYRIGFMLAGTCVLGGLVLFGFAASVLLRPIFVYRYMLSAMGCFWLSFAIGLDLFFQKESKYALCKLGSRSDSLELCNLGNEAACAELCKSDCKLACLELCKLNGKMDGLHKVISVAVIILVLVVGLRDYRAFMGEEEYKALLMKDTAAALSTIEPEDIVLYNFDQVQAVTSYYMDEKAERKAFSTIDNESAEADKVYKNESYLWCGRPETLIQKILRPYGTVEQAEQIRTWCEEGRRVWFIGSFNSRDDIVAEWEKAGLLSEETGSYLLERYWFNLYKISVAGQ